MSTMARFLSVLSLVPLCSLAAACGTSYQTNKVKEYRLAVLSEDTALKREFRSLIADFNSYAGVDVLRYVDDPATANSAIIITDGLRARDGKVGWGQWMSETRSENPLSVGPGRRPKRTVSFTMRLEFDLDYFKSRQGNDATMRVDKQKLFFHEAGHGMEMDHNPGDRRDVMYPDVSGEKDFEPFFRNVRAYMQDR